MKRAMIKPDACLNCEPCIVAVNCTNSAIIREHPSDKPWVDFYHCRGCMKCLAYCPHQAVEEIVHPCAGRPNQGW